MDNESAFYHLGLLSIGLACSHYMLYLLGSQNEYLGYVPLLESYRSLAFLLTFVGVIFAVEFWYIYLAFRYGALE